MTVYLSMRGSDVDHSLILFVACVSVCVCEGKGGKEGRGGEEGEAYRVRTLSSRIVKWDAMTS